MLTNFPSNVSASRLVHVSTNPRLDCPRVGLSATCLVARVRCSSEDGDVACGVWCAASTARPVSVMSSDLTMYNSGSNVFNSSTTTTTAGASGDDLSYAEAFPPLPTSGTAGNGADAMLPASPTSSGKNNQWGKKMSLRSSTTTQVRMVHYICVVSRRISRFCWLLT